MSWECKTDGCGCCGDRWCRACHDGPCVRENQRMDQLRAALVEACDGWEGLWTSDHNDEPPPRIAALRKIAEGK